MKDHIGETYSGTITGVTQWGMYVEEKETKCEGMISLRTMTDDFYKFNEKAYCIVGEKTKKKYTLGDTVKFKIIGADMEKKTLDYALVA